MKTWFAAGLIVAALLLAGSDGPLFPLPNLAGVLLLALVGTGLNACTDPRI